MMLESTMAGATPLLGRNGTACPQNVEPLSQPSRTLVRMTGRFVNLLNDIGISRDDVLFVHSSMDWIGGGISEAVALIEALLEVVGNKGTLVMPSYTWRGICPGRPPEGVVVDLRRSPCAVGLLPEVFRRWPGVVRSASYWVPICALGPQASQLTANQAEIANPFAPDSTFYRLSETGARLVGLGVSLNTSSVSHLPDYDLASICPLEIFTEEPIDGEVIDCNGRHLKTRTTIVRPEVMAHYRPSATFEHCPALRAQLAFVQRDKASFFSYPIDLYHREGVSIGRQFLGSGQLPPWLGIER
jgi:aminoglycoside N3'-acetyltransferase